MRAAGGAEQLGHAVSDRPEPEEALAARDYGWALTEFGGLLLLLATLIAWQKPLGERVGLYVLLCLLGFPLQPLLAAGGEHHRFVGMFHPVNAILLLGLSGPARPVTTPSAGT